MLCCIIFIDTKKVLNSSHNKTSTQRSFFTELGRGMKKNVGVQVLESFRLSTFRMEEEVEEIILHF